MHPVFLLDEAHLLHSDMLAHLHILLNYEWDAKALLSLLLVGLPELEGNLQRRAHAWRKRPQRKLVGLVAEERLVEDSRVLVAVVQAEQELVQAETVSFPFAALILILVFASLVAAGMPLVVAALAIPGML